MTSGAESPTVEFGAWLEKTLRDKRMTISELSERARVSRGTLYHYIKGRRVPDRVALDRVARALGIEAESMPTVVPKRNGRPPLPKEDDE
jgi:transcriptional regulator with XRE-family HTH domain